MARALSPAGARAPVPADRELKGLLKTALITMCNERGLDDTGTKADLIGRLQAAPDPDPDAGRDEQALVSAPKAGRGARASSPGRAMTPSRDIERDDPGSSRLSEMKRRAMELGAREGEVDKLSDDAVLAGEDPRVPVTALIASFESLGVLTPRDAIAKARQRSWGEVKADSNDPSARVVDLLYDVDGYYQWAMWFFCWPCVLSLFTLMLSLCFEWGSLNLRLILFCIFVVCILPALLTWHRRKIAHKQQDENLFYLNLSDVADRATTVTMLDMISHPWMQNRRHNQRAADTQNLIARTAAGQEISNQVRFWSLQRTIARFW